MNAEKIWQLISVGVIIYLYWKWTRQMATDPQYPRQMATNVKTILKDFLKVSYISLTFLITIVAIQTNYLESIPFLVILYIPPTWYLWKKKKNKIK